MLKTSFLLLALFVVPVAVNAQPAERMEASCTACHNLSVIAQQRLDRGGWTREVDKMIRWGAQVPPAERDGLIDYFTSLFNPSRARPNTAKTLPEGKGKDVIQTSCMSCHDDTPMAAQKLDRAGWVREIDKMIRWGALVPDARKEDVLEYLLTNFPR